MHIDDEYSTVERIESMARTIMAMIGCCCLSLFMGILLAEIFYRRDSIETSLCPWCARKETPNRADRVVLPGPRHAIVN